MALAFQRNEIDIERTGRSVTVPNNDVARLMYYLNCVCNTIDCNDDPDIQRFTNYHNWSYLSSEEQKALLVVCYAFSPDVFDDKVFFHSDALCGNSSNEFYTINQVRSQLFAVESIIIAGRQRQVNKIMTYKMSWMKTYYYDPMQRLVSRLGNSSRPVTYSPRYTQDVERQPIMYNNDDSPRCTTGRICCCLCCLVIVIPALIGIIIAIVHSINN